MTDELQKQIDDFYNQINNESIEIWGTEINDLIENADPINFESEGRKSQSPVNSEAPSTDDPEEFTGYSRGQNIAIGVIEIILGLGVAGAGAYAAYASAGLATSTAGSGGVKTGLTAVAVGITRVVGSNNKPLRDDAGMIFLPMTIGAIKVVDEWRFKE